MKGPIAMRNGIRAGSLAAKRGLEAAAGPNPRYRDKESAHSRDSCSAGAVVFKRRNSTACQPVQIRTRDEGWVPGQAGWISRAAPTASSVGAKRGPYDRKLLAGARRGRQTDLHRESIHA